MYGRAPQRSGGGLATKQNPHALGPLGGSYLASKGHSGRIGVSADWGYAGAMLNGGAASKTAIARGARALHLGMRRFHWAFLSQSVLLLSR
jgi:hypothetical protein